MTKQYDRTNRGVLFRNDRKTSDKHPDRKGSINIEGKEYWLSGWDKEDDSGQINLSATPKEARAAASDEFKPAAAFEDFVPF